MIPELDIWRAAQAMVKRYGDGAATEAAMRADEFLDQGTPDGQRVCPSNGPWLLPPSQYIGKMEVGTYVKWEMSDVTDLAGRSLEYEPNGECPLSWMMVNG